MRNLLLIAAVSPFLAWVSTTKPVSPAVEQLRSLQAALHKTHANNDWHANLVYANKLKELLNGSPDALLEVARADTRVGDFNAAFHELEQFVSMGQSTDLLTTSSDFSSLLKRADFAKIRDRMRVNSTAISLGSTALLLSDSGLLTEDMDYDASTQRFFVTSIREKKITTVSLSGAHADFAKAPDDWPVMAVKIDPSRGVLWATEVAMQGYNFVPKSDWGKSAILCYDLKSGKLLRRIDGPYGSSLGDMVLSVNGDVIVSDGDGGGVYRILARSTRLERLDAGDFISPQTPAMHPDGRHVFVPDYARGIGVLDIATKRVRWLSMRGMFALNGIDGLYFSHGRLIAVQNGTLPERVVVFTLDRSLARIESERIIDRSTHTLGVPTHGVVIGNDFYYIANSGWDAMDDRGDVKPGAHPSVPRIMRAQLWQRATLN